MLNYLQLQLLNFKCQANCSCLPETNEASHAKTDLQDFVIVIAKEGGYQSSATSDSVCRMVFRFKLTVIVYCMGLVFYTRLKYLTEPLLKDSCNMSCYGTAYIPLIDDMG